MDRFIATFAAQTCAEVVEVITGQEFADRFAEELGVDEHGVRLTEVADRLEHELRLTFSSRRIPRPFNRIVPARVSVQWDTVWTRSDDGSFSATFAATSAYPSASCTGSSTLHAVDGRVRWELTGQVTAERSGLVPARAVESGLARLLGSVLADEVTVANRLLDPS